MIHRVTNMYSPYLPLCSGITLYYFAFSTILISRIHSYSPRHIPLPPKGHLWRPNSTFITSFLSLINFFSFIYSLWWTCNHAYATSPTGICKAGICKVHLSQLKLSSQHVWIALYTIICSGLQQPNWAQLSLQAGFYHRTFYSSLSQVSIIRGDPQLGVSCFTDNAHF